MLENSIGNSYCPPVNELLNGTTCTNLMPWYITMDTEPVETRKQWMSMVGMNSQFNKQEHAVILLTYAQPTVMLELVS